MDTNDKFPIGHVKTIGNVTLVYRGDNVWDSDVWKNIPADWPPPSAKYKDQ